MKRRILIYRSILFIGGCTTGLNPINSSSKKSVKPAPKKLKFAVVDATGIEELQENYEAFRTALEEVLSIPIEFFPVQNRTGAVPALQSGEVDIIFAGPSEYVILNSRAKAIPIVAIQRSQYYPIIVVRADSKIKSLVDLKGKTIAMRSIGSTSGHLAPTKMLIDAGLDPNTDVKIVMLGNAGVQALKKSEVDAWTIASDRYKTVLESEGFSEKDFSILAKGSLLPSDLFVVSNQINSEFIENMRSRMIENQQKLIQSLLVSPVNQPYKGSKFIPANDADYNMIREVYQKIGQGSFLS
jgi:phosphonate transport system substrate-binding protein